jgi:UrcA family protein
MNTAIKTQSRSLASLCIAALAALACITSSQRADAQPAEFLTKTVSFKDLDLNSEQGARIFYVRLQHAAREVCSPFKSLELSRRRTWQSCVDNALGTAVTTLNNPLVAALHNMRATRSSAG